MYHNVPDRLAFVLGLGLLTLVPAAKLAAQYEPRDPTPRSSVGGHTSQELRSIYRQDVGRGFTIASQNAIALRQAQATVPYVGQSTTPYGRQRLEMGLTSGAPEKPFANATSRPAVSPYLNLFRDELDGSDDFNYQTLVRPQLQQLELNQRLQDQQQAIAQRVQLLSARPAYNPEGAQNLLPTGHQTVFGFYGRFYPTMGAQRR